MRSRLHSIVLLGLLLALAGVSASWACQTTHTACVTPCLEANTSCCTASVDAGIAPPSLELNLLQAANGTILYQPTTAPWAALVRHCTASAVSQEATALSANGCGTDLYLLDSSFLI